MTKKMKRVSVDSAPAYGFGEDARTMFKHQSLLQDYEELQKETNAIKRKLKKAKQRKQTLMAEVSFLRRRYNYLMEIQSQKVPSEQDLESAPIPETHEEAVPREKSCKRKEVALPNPSPILDLNQISNGEEGDFLIASEPLREKKSKKLFTNKGKEHLLPPLPPRPPSDLKFECRNTGKGSNQPGKKKISWQDPVALRV